MYRDAVALCDWAAMLEEELQAGVKNWTEISAAESLAR